MSNAMNDTKYEKWRQYNHNWEHDFESPELYVDFKLKMLRKEMYIEPTEPEVAHLKELKTMGDIDRAVHSSIDRHWS